MEGSTGQGMGRALTVSTIASVSLAIAAVVILALVGRPLAGLALGIGLALGGANGFLVRRTVSPGVPFSAVSLGRIALLSVVGLGIGFLLGANVAWLVVLGIGASQLVLAGMSAYEVLHG